MMLLFVLTVIKSASRLFPFLIGKVLTNDGEIMETEIEFTLEFPFLIGKVLTTVFKPL